jgi:hypothetical protein
MKSRLAGTGAAIALILLVGGCGGSKSAQSEADSIETNGSQTDPAISSALGDQIMVDPALTQQRDGDARPGTGQSPIPSTLPGAGAAEGQTLGEAAQAQAAGRAATSAACYRNLQYSAGWAQRLPAALPAYPDAQLREAAGNSSGGCNVRIASFATSAEIGQVTNFYAAAGRKGGYAVETTAEGTGRAVGGDKGPDAFYATLRPRVGGGTEIDIVTNHGR